MIMNINMYFSIIVARHVATGWGWGSCPFKLMSCPKTCAIYIHVTPTVSIAWMLSPRPGLGLEAQKIGLGLVLGLLIFGLCLGLVTVVASASYSLPL